MMHHANPQTSEPAPETPAGNRVLLALRSLAYRDFRLLWLSTIGNSATMWMEIVVRSWLVWQLTGSLVGVATVNLIRMVPAMVLAIPAGVITDRVDRKRLLVAAQATMLALYILLAVLALTGQLTLMLVYLIFFVLGTATTFTQPARQSLIPMIVPRGDITNAVALQQAGFNASRLVGPALAGFVMDGFGAGTVFVLMAISSGTVVLATALLRVPSSAFAGQGAASPFAAALHGLAYVARTPILRLLILLSFLVMLLGWPSSTLLPAFADDVFNIGARGFGLFMSASGVGSFIATLVVASLAFKRPGAAVVTGLILFAVTLISFAYTPWLIPALVIMGLGGLFSGVQMTLGNGLLLSQSDGAYHGRIMSLNMLNHGFMPLGAIPAAAVADAVGPQATMAIMGLALIVATLALTAIQPGVMRIRATQQSVAGGPPHARPMPVGGSGG